MTKELDKALGSAAAITSIAAAVVAADLSAPIVAIAALGVGATLTGAALYHKLTSENLSPPKSNAVGVQVRSR